MKFCAVICEYNPFHNGHAYLFRAIRERTDADAVLCLMSGNFTQRGEAAVFGKYERASHAVRNGADVVLELPAAFATAPAELFARGAVHILASVPSVDYLAFGCESGSAEEFLRTARAALREDKPFQSALKARMKEGLSYKVALTETLLSLEEGLDEALLTHSNNILGVEYCRAICMENADMVPVPVVRKGATHADTVPISDFSSATAIRGILPPGTWKERNILRRNVPSDVFASALPATPPRDGTALLYALLRADEEQLRRTPDCSEGLENRLKALAKSNPVPEEFLEKAASKRYTRSRIRRLLMQNFLGIGLDDVKKFLSAPLYLRTLAVNKERAEDILSALSESTFPVIARKSDYSLLRKDALACFGIDCRANDLYCVLSGTHCGDFETRFL